MSLSEYENIPKTFRPIITFLYTPLVHPSQHSKSFFSFPNIFSLSRKKRNTKVYIYFKDFHDIPIEFLSAICKYLEPSDLFALSGVCKNLRTLLLDIELPQIQELWQKSREEFSPFLSLPPPQGMTEQEYFQLNDLSRGCQFCGQRKRWVSVEWAFRVRTCEECCVVRFVKRPTIDKEELRQREHNEKRRLEFIFNHRKQRLSEIMDELETEILDDNESIKSGYSGRSSLNGGTLKFDSNILRKCPVYSEERKLTYRPFTKRDESRFMQTIDYEYQILVKHYGVVSS
ncbi:9485_t:CDS:2 [Diversispora eburnea]|uniref:9485_t:CDS:1 n=1 Tax=Diversispora eburnea TaxID=1213867 RepID=A0A9N8YNK2_9GLOM|nr:9485_t:CDS:2 [Diversispora eburnea]